jgi:exopolysaccharide biosynthesis polyprenyl glycosylphosphotransferase
MTSHGVTWTARPPENSSRIVAGRWECGYRRMLIVLDGSAALLAAGVAYLGGSGADRATWGDETYAAVSAAAPVAWVFLLALAGGYDLRRLGDRGHDLRQVLVAGAIVLGVVAWLTWATPLQVPRNYVLLLTGTTAVLTLGGRQWRRHALLVRRRRGECIQRVLAVGQPSAVRALAEHLGRQRHPAAVLVGYCLPDRGRILSRAGRRGLEPGWLGDDPVPVFGNLGDVVGAVHWSGADTVAVLPCPELEDPDLRRLAWTLEGRARHFVVVPGLAEVDFPRLTVRPIGGLPVVHVRDRRLSGAGWLAKSVLDRGLAFVALVALAPLLLAIAVAVRATTPGPALFRQSRVGVHGREFRFVKFRTMYVGAEQRRAELAGRNINADGVLFKVRGDPRVTPIGAFLRRWSLDELPQLLNVLAGHMSLVGPRPPLPEEVARYGDDVRRRLLVKPGITGLWQTSGRSDLSWDEAVRLDLRYVDNWSLRLDAAILSRTVSAVLHGTGAY